MKNFKEWLSDYLRYIMLFLAAVLVFFLVMIGVRLYQRRSEPDLRDVVEIYPETGDQGESERESGTPAEKAEETESETESETETETESEAQEEPEKVSEKSSEKASEDASESTSEKKRDSRTQTEKENAGEEESETSLLPENGSGVTITRQSETQTSSTPGTTPAPSSAPSTVPAPSQTQTPSLEPMQIPEPTPAPTPVPETEPPTETETDPPEPVYMTLTGSCYLRSGPGYEYEIIGEYIYGTTVQVLDDSIGWYKVQVDGMTGYMGGRFFH